MHRVLSLASKLVVSIAYPPHFARSLFTRLILVDRARGVGHAIWVLRARATESPTRRSSDDSSDECDEWGPGRGTQRDCACVSVCSRSACKL
jgi:hypothetical protein